MLTITQKGGEIIYKQLNQSISISVKRNYTLTEN